MGTPLLRFLYRKMWNTRWLTLSTLIGLIVAVSFTISIPMYADGALKRVVSKSLQERNQGFPAGSLLIRYQGVGSEVADLDSVNAVDQYIEQDVPEDVGFPYYTYVNSMSIRSSDLTPVDPNKVDPGKRRQMTVMSMNAVEEHAEILNGTMPSAVVEAGVIEAIVLEESLYRNDFQVGDSFVYPIRGGLGIQPLTIKVVGTYSPKDPTHPYWYSGIDGMINSFIVDEGLFQSYLLEEQGIPLNLMQWYYAFDLREIQTSQLAPLGRTLERLDIDLYQLLKDTKVDISFNDMLVDFKRQSLQLQTLLFTLAAPMIAMVFYYIAMNARQSLEKQRSDIAVLRSRGGSTRQIIWIYLLEGIILGTIALVLGPLFGWFMAKTIGSSSGFLTFVNRQSIPVGIAPSTMLYGLTAVVIAVISSIIPAIVFARSSIVGLKQQMARVDRKPIWQRWYLDIALIGAAAYGWYSFNERQFIAMRSGLTTDQLQIQPMLFFVPAITIISLGLFFLRVFPWLLKLFNWLGRRFLPVPIFLTLTQLSRSAKAYYPIMLLLILTLGLGVYNSSAARTIDLNSTERTLYQYGTDVVMQTVWEGYAANAPQAPSSPNNGGEDGDGGGNGGGNPNNPGNTPPQQMLYQEPPFEIFKNLDGVEQAARVLQTQGNVIVSGRSTGQGTVMGIDNVDFAEVGWFREDLYPVQQNYYLDFLGDYEQSALVAENFAEKYQLKPGDVFSIVIEQREIEFVIVGVLPYWPSQYPDQAPFFIVNLDYVYDQVPLIPYEVWMKMEEGAKLTPLVKTLNEKGIELASIKDVRNELIVQQKHPARGGVFGILSLGFLVSVIISLIGYVLYWFFNLSGRVVQFGVLRAMGLSRRQLTGMLLLEQGFTAGLSIVLGIGIGKLASYLFLPFLQTTENIQTRIPPFRVVFDSKDTLQLYMVVAVMMLTGAFLLFMHIRRLKVHQAVKLGEER
jgi:putative ABC transport system permease protein